MSNYDKHYQTEDLFGDPYPELITFFENYPTRGRALDLGCGQGRDTLALARLGFIVTGVDNSKVGIHQMIEQARREETKVRGIVADIYALELDEKFNVVLLDSMIHFQKNDIEKEEGLLRRAMQFVAEGGVLCNFMLKSAPKEKRLKRLFDDSDITWTAIHEDYITYHYHDKASDFKSESTYQMLVMRRI